MDELTPQPRNPPPAASPPIPEPALPRARFCRTCGTALGDPDGLCPGCDSAASDPAATAAGPSLDPPPAGSLASAMTLYFVILLSFAPLIWISSDDQLATAELMVSGLDTVIVLAWVLVGWAAFGPMLTRLGPLRAYPVAAALSLFTVGFAIATIDPLTRIFDLPEFTYSETYLDAGYGWWVVILAIVVQPAIVEELAFRGVIYNGLRRVMTTQETVIVSAMMFTVIHLNVLGFPYLFVIGVLLGILRAWTGVLWPCILLHALHNGAIIALEAWNL